MASFGDSILRLFKKVAKQSDQHESADGEPQLDGSEEAASNQLGEPGGCKASSEQDPQIKNDIEKEPEMPVRHKEFLHGNFANPGETRESKWQKQPVFDRHNIRHDDSDDEDLDKREDGAERQAAHSISFDRAVTQSRIEEERAEDDIAASIKVFADVVPGDDLNSVDDWKTRESDTLAPGRSSNATEESFKQVAACPTTSPSTLTWLSTQPSSEIRASVASNHHTPSETLRKLATDSDYNVRLAVAGNKRAADDLLKQLTHDENRLVSGEAFSALSVREKSNIQNSLSGFHKLPQPRVNNPVQTKVPIIGSTPGTPVKTPTGMNVPKYTPPLSQPSSTFSALPPSIPPATPASAPASAANTPARQVPEVAKPAPSSPPVPSELPPNAARVGSAAVTPGMLTPRSLPKPTVASPPPSGLPSNIPSGTVEAKTGGRSEKIAETKSVTKPETKPETKFEPKSETKSEPKSETKTEAKTAPATPDGHDLLTNHKFKTTSNHLVASYTDLEAINVEIDNRSPGAWLSLNSEGAIKAYKKQKDTVKDVKINFGAAASDGPKRTSPIVNITPNASASETIAFLRIVAGRISTPPGRLVELAAHEDTEVRAAVAENVNLPADGFALLARDVVSTVKLRLIDNCNCPTDVLGMLQTDSDPYVAFEAKNALKRIGAGLLKEREHNQFRPQGH
jgi:hypothetical protein